MSDQSIQSARGTLGLGPDGQFQVEFVRDLPQPPEKAWLWLTQPEKLARWLPGCVIEAHAGGDVSFDFGEEGTATGTVLEVLAPDQGEGLLKHTWVWEGVPTSVVTWRLTSRGDGSQLTLRHSELVEGPAREFAMGWHLILDCLELDCAGQPTDSAWAAADQVAGLYLNS